MKTIALFSCIFYLLTSVVVHSKNPHCSIARESIGCNKINQRYYWDSEIRGCMPYPYGGCGGQSNGFGTLSECERNCSQILASNFKGEKN